MLEMTPLPDNAITVSPSQLSMFKMCHFAWKFNYRDKIKRRGTKQHFEVGTYVHDLFHVMFQVIEQGMEPGSPELKLFMADRIQEDFAMNATGETNEANWIETLSIVTKAVMGYITKQSPIIDSGITPVGIEQEITIPMDIEIEGRPVFAHGFIDLIYKKKMQRGYRIRDHKTGANPRAHSAAKTEANSQLLFYAAWLDYVGLDISGVEISFIHTNPPKTGKDWFGFYPFAHNSESFRSYRAQVIRDVQRMYQEEPERNRTDACTSCSYWEICKHEVRGLKTNGIRSELYEPVKPPNRLASG